MAIYKKGEDESGLRSSALQQGIAEASATRGMTSEQRYERDVKSGVQGAKNAVNLKATVKEATDSPVMFGGPVSGAALAKLKAKKSAAKATKEKEMKRR
jgi:hypothetical protein